MNQKIFILTPIDFLQKIIDWYSKSLHRFDNNNTYDIRAMMSADTLSRAVHINMSYCDLDSMPPEIGHLTNACGLFINYCRITSLPAEIVQLINLKNLALYGNELT